MRYMLKLSSIARQIYKRSPVSIVVEILKAARLMLEAYKLLLEAADSMRDSKLDKEKSFEHLLRSLEELAVSITDMRALGILDPETAREVENLFKKALSL